MNRLRLFGFQFAPLLMGLLSLVAGSQRLDAAAPAEVARQILSPETSDADRERLIARHKDQSAEVIVAMAEGLGGDSKEEYRRIPWIWRVAVAAGKRNQADELRKILDISLPRNDQPMTDWQAVVIGGGVINGLTMAGVWPDQRIAELVKGHGDLEVRWKSSLEQAVAMSDREETPTGTRYDALRMIAMSGWKACGEQLTRYLGKDTHPELQMGAVSGTADVNDPAATTALITHLNDLEAGNRELALDGLLRTEDRQLALLQAITEQKIDAGLLGDVRRKRLLESTSESVRSAALQALKK